MAIKVRELLTKLTFKSDKGELRATNKQVGKSKKKFSIAAREARKFRREMNKLATAAKTVAAIAIGSRVIKFFTSDFTSGADAAAKLSQATGVALETYLGLSYAIERSGGDTSNLNKGLTQVGKRALEASQGLKTQQRAFDAIGVSVKDASGELKNQDELLYDLADAFSSMQDGSRKTALAMMLFGDTGATLLPLFNEGAKGIKGMVSEAKRLGLVFSPAQAKAAEEYQDRMLDAKSVLIGIRNTIASAIIPYVTEAATRFRDWATTGDNLQHALAIAKRAAKALSVVLAAFVAQKIGKYIASVASAASRGAAALRLMGIAGAWARVKMGILVAAISGIAWVIYELHKIVLGQDSVLKKWIGDPAQIESVKAMATEMFSALNELWAEIKPAVIELGKALLETLVELWAALKPIIPYLIQGLALAIRLLAPILKYFIKFKVIIFKAFIYPLKLTIKLFQWLYDIASDTINWFIDGFREFGDLVEDIFNSMGIDVRYWARVAVYAFKKFHRAVKWIFDAIHTTIKWIADTLGDAFAFAAKVAKAAWEPLRVMFADIKAAIKWIIEQTDKVLGRAKKLGAKKTIEGALTGQVNLTDDEKKAIKRQNSKLGGLSRGLDKINVGGIKVTVNSAPNMEPAELEKRIKRSASEALQETINRTYGDRAPVTP